MTAENLKSLPGFIAWVEEGEARGFLRALADHVDSEVGDSGFVDALPHHSLMNAGIQNAVRCCRHRIADPLGRTRVVKAAPPATYGVTAAETEPEWK